MIDKDEIYLSCHDALSFNNQLTIRAYTFSPAAQFFMTF